MFSNLMETIRQFCACCNSLSNNHLHVQDMLAVFMKTINVISVVGRGPLLLFV